MTGEDKTKQNIEKGTGHLAENEKHFKAIFMQAVVGVILVKTKTGKFLKANKKYCDIVGYSEEELLKMDFQSITHPEDRKSDPEFMERLISGEIREFSKEKRYIRKNGDLVWVIGTVSAMWNPNEEPDYHITVVQDITERKKANEELKKHRDHLEELVKERTAELNKKNEELERFNKLFVGRELRMIELKQIITEKDEKISELEGKSSI